MREKGDWLIVSGSQPTQRPELPEHQPRVVSVRLRNNYAQDAWAVTRKRELPVF